MIFPKFSKPGFPAASLRRGFTLMEVMISSVIFVVLVSAVMTMVVLQVRFGASIGNYSDMNTASRQVMTRFEQDMRSAVSVTVADSRSMEIQVIRPSLGVSDIVGVPLPATETVIYKYDEASGVLSRNNSPLLRELLDCQFVYFNPLDATTKKVNEIKKVLLAATMRRSVSGGASGVTNSDYLVSAVVTMRCRNN